MVVPLGPGKFYGSSLPRPRIYTDVKFNADRVDPPVPVSDAFMSWANEAHWSMGGLSFKRVRLQGRIEGNVDRLRKQKEKVMKTRVDASPVGAKSGVQMKKGKKREGSESPPPAPKAMKRRKFMDLFDESEEEEEAEVVRGKRKMVRKLVGDFERVAKEKVSDAVMKVVEEINSENEEGKKKKKSGNGGGKRSSPRLAKQR